MTAENTKEKHNTVDLTEGSIWKKLLLFFIPIAVGTLLQQLYNAVDSIIVGRFVGTSALAAVGGSSAIMTQLAINICVSLASGAAVVIAQRFGAGDARITKMAVGTAVTSFLLMGIIIAIAMFFLSRPILLLLNTPAETVEQSLTYCRIYFAGSIFMVFFNIGSAILRAVGNSTKPLIYLIISCLSNIALDLIFVLAFGLGVAGVALATIIAQAISCVFIILDLTKTNEIYKLEKNNLRINFTLFGKMMKIGVPSCIQSSMYGISNLIITITVNSLGTVTVASWAMSGKIDGVYWAISEAFGVAIMNFVAQNYGAKKYDRIRKGSKTCTLVFLGVTVLLSCLLLLVARPLLRVFTPDVAVQETTWHVITYFVPLYFTWSIIEALSGILRGLGDTIVPAIILAFGVCAVRIVWLFTIFKLYPTLFIVSMSYPLSWVITDIALAIYYFYKRKKFYATAT